MGTTVTITQNTTDVNISQTVNQVEISATTVYTGKYGFFVGSGGNCTGTDGATDRVLTLNNNPITLSGGYFNMFVEGRAESTDALTLTHQQSGTTVEFTKRIWDTDNIFAQYYTG